MPFTKTPGRWLTLEETQPRLKMFQKIEVKTEQGYKRGQLLVPVLMFVIGAFIVWNSGRPDLESEKT